LCYVSLASKEQEERRMMAVSTEDGRILFYNTEKISSISANGTNTKEQAESSIPDATLVATVGGKAAGVTTRIKDFEVLFVRPNAGAQEFIAIITAGSDGTIRVIQVSTSDLSDALNKESAPQLGTVIGSYESGNRITCLKAFVMLPADDEDFEDKDGDFEGFDEDEGSEESESERESDGE